MDDLDKLFENDSPVKPASGGTIEDHMMNEIQACWALPAYKQGDILPETKVTANVGKDGSLLGDPIILKSGKDTLGRQLAESAVRAIKRCAPFKTVKDNPQAYEQLRTIIFNFKPSAL
ncbi:cell envelope integrity protein TolA [Phyllobacterium sp. SB3]|uniref:cell envelope integrity protein TolA n=1 Tax=Phyllobacterium sp. SB3 TaxID=3156073 RepID=UPI0032AEAC15